MGSLLNRQQAGVLLGAMLLLAWPVAVRGQGSFVPTPDKAMSFALEKDPRKWESKYTAGNSHRVILELVPEGQSIEAWNEMVAQQIDFTALPLTEHFQQWKAMLRRADPKIEITETRLPDSSILATYTSLSANEMSLRRFILAGDGVYMLAYHVRPGLKRDATWALWRDIVSQAKLVPNPEKRR